MEFVAHLPGNLRTPPAVSGSVHFFMSFPNPLRLLLILGTFVATLNAAAPRSLELTLDGLKRTALIVPPTVETAAGAPVVFAFHGHGGSSANAARSFHLHTLWPEAIVIYPEGVPTPGRLTDPAGKLRGWQHTVGDHGDRDLKFFDALLAAARRDFRTDSARIYSTGHSNGAGFTYLLWHARPGVFAAIAPSAGGFSARQIGQPIPVLHLAGERDTTVLFANQQRMMAAVRKINGCEENPQPWGTPPQTGCLLYPSAKGTPFVSFIHPGDHKYPAEAPALIVKFFQEHPANTGTPSPIAPR